jgi:glycine cleavage system H protein
MAEFLEFTLDKFTFKVATDRYYNTDGMWIKADGSRVTVGLSDYLQQRSGDVAFAEVARESTTIAVGDEIANIETIKVNISLPSPISGMVVEVNPALEMEAEVINQDPYGTGWLVVMEATDWTTDQVNLLDPQAYFAHMKAEAEEEVKKL